jgi:hypothetical protein
MPDLESYVGNAGLGAGSNPGIAVVSPNDNLKVINDTARDVMLLDAERNMKIFSQKVRDRDALTKLILDNQVSTKDIDESYLPKFLDIKKETEKAYNEWGGNPNDIKGYKKYQDTVADLQDYAAHSQTNTKELDKLKAERAAETLPWKQKKLDDWINQEVSKTKKDPWAVVNPYQNLFNFSLDPIQKLYKTNTTSVMSPDGLWKSDVTVGDFAGTLKNAQSELLNNGETSEDMREWLTQVDAYDPAKKKQFVDSINGQLAKYNQERGLQPGQPGYADPLQLGPAPDGVDHINADPATFAAKYAIANQERYVTSTGQVFQKDLGTFKTNQEKNAIAWAKMNKVDIPKAWAYIDRWKTQKKQLTEQEQVGAQKYNDLVDKIEVGTPGDSTVDKRVGSLNRINTDQLPRSRQFIGGITYDASGKKMLGRVYPNMNFFEKGNLVKDKDLSFSTYESEVKDKKTKLDYPDWAKAKGQEKGYTVESYYDVKYYDPNGKELKSEDDLSPALSKAYAKAQKDYGMNFSQFLKGLSKLGQTVVEIHGADGGVATPQTILEGSRLEQEQYGKKGFEGIYGGDEQDQGTGGDENPGQ